MNTTNETPLSENDKISENYKISNSEENGFLCMCPHACVCDRASLRECLHSAAPAMMQANERLKDDVASLRHDVLQLTTAFIKVDDVYRSLVKSHSTLKFRQPDMSASHWNLYIAMRGALVSLAVARADMKLLNAALAGVPHEECAGLLADALQNADEGNACACGTEYAQRG